MTTAADLVAEAMAWLGTPFHWQASLKGKGCDCKGLVLGVARELGLPEADGPWGRIADYGRRPPIDVLRQGLTATLARVDAPRPGDVLLMTLSRRPQHLGILGDGVVIHTYCAGPMMVIATPETVARATWPPVSAWRFPSLEPA